MEFWLPLITGISGLITGLLSAWPIVLYHKTGIRRVTASYTEDVHKPSNHRVVKVTIQNRSEVVLHQATLSFSYPYDKSIEIGESGYGPKYDQGGALDGSVMNWSVALQDNPKMGESASAGALLPNGVVSHEFTINYVGPLPIWVSYIDHENRQWKIDLRKQKRVKTKR